MDFATRYNARFQVSCPPELLKEIDSFANSHYLTRSGLVCVAVSQYINAQRMGDAMEALYKLMEKLVNEKGSPEDFAQLEKIHDMVKLVRPDA